MDTRHLHLFIAMAVLIPTRQHSTELRGHMLFHYNNQTLAECPKNTYQVEFSSNCTTACPGFAPYLFQSVCLSFCPIGYVAKDGHCILQFQKTPVRLDTKLNFVCQTGFCPEEMPFCFEYKCRTTCPEGMFSEDFSCVYTCSKLRPFISNNSCVSSCPKTFPYSEDYHCVVNCSLERVISESTCVKVCPQGKHRTVSNCVNSCLPENRYEMKIWNTSLCLTQCPSFTNVNDNECHVQCPHGLDFLWNMSCVQKCPDSMPYVYVLSRRLPPYKTAVCLPYCPDKFYIDDRTCVDECSTEMKILDQKCVKECPKTRKFVHQQTCVSTCPKDFVMYNDTCIFRCPLKARYVLNNTCLETCPSNYKVLDDKCVSKCPPTHSLFKGRCSPTCPSPLRAYNGSCVRECPTSHPYNGVKHFAIDTTRYAAPACVKSCDGRYLSNMTCLYQCPSNLFIFTNSCVEKCPNVSRFYLNRRCLAACPDNYVSLNGSCIPTCPYHLTYLFDNECLDQCPPTHAFRFRSLGLTYCYDSCKNNTYGFEIGDYIECIPSCNETSLFTLNDKCVFECPALLDNFTCVNRCPISKQYVYHTETRGRLVRQCISQCPGKTFITANKCYDACPAPFVSFLGNRSCLHQCPSTHKFRFLYRSNSKDLFRCTITCNKPRYIFGDQCVPKCPESQPHSIGQRCVVKCDAKYKFFDPKTRKCLTHCSAPYVITNKTCVETCPSESRFLVNNICTNKCPHDMNMSSPFPRAHICADTCVDPFIRDNNTCVRSCSRGQVIVNKECINSQYCPREYVYSEQSKQGKICRKMCQKNEFINNTNCVKSCDSHFVNRECVEKCPTTHPFTEETFTWKNSECHKKCPSSKFTEGLKCVVFCSSKLYIENVDTCVKHCPASHPFRVEMLIGGMKCVTKCTNENMIHDTTHCISKSECYKKHGLIFKDQCVQQCPKNSFLDMTRKNCLSLTDSTLVVALVLVLLTIALATYVCLIVKCRSPSVKAYITANIDEMPLHGEKNYEDECVSDIDQEISLISFDHNHPEHVSDVPVPRQLSMPAIEIHTQTESTTSVQVGDTYAGEMEVDEATELKTLISKE